MLPKKHRLNLKIETVKGRRYSTPELTMVASPSSTTKIGVIVSKKVSPKAVVRNQIKRKILSILKDKLDTITPHHLVFITNPRTTSLDHIQLTRTIEKLLGKINRKTN